MDLHTRKVMYSDPRSPRRIQYEIAGTNGKVNGHLAKEITFSNKKNGARLGFFKQESGKNWAELGAKGNKRFSFVEVGRDDWSVYLLDRSRKVNIQLDMHTEKVMYNLTGKPKSTLYLITSVK